MINDKMIERSQMRKKKWIKEVQDNPKFGDSKQDCVIKCFE
jgi:hypothetical protein